MVETDDSALHHIMLYRGEKTAKYHRLNDNRTELGWADPGRQVRRGRGKEITAVERAAQCFPHKSPVRDLVGPYLPTREKEAENPVIGSDE